MYYQFITNKQTLHIVQIKGLDFKWLIKSDLNDFCGSAEIIRLNRFCALKYKVTATLRKLTSNKNPQLIKIEWLFQLIFFTNFNLYEQISIYTRLFQA